MAMMLAETGHKVTSTPYPEIGRARWPCPTLSMSDIEHEDFPLPRGDNFLELLAFEFLDRRV